ncbi:unnamed protein product [Ilex paraguariensis]|uniref:Uncharacterized protein n=1 Tax=Ilex paraguariensis TaxID=185542 RepID=A0ABC8U957_9AQUA
MAASKVTLKLLDMKITTKLKRNLYATQSRQDLTLEPQNLSAEAPPTLLDDVPIVKVKKFYKCSNPYNHLGIVDDLCAICPSYSYSLCVEVPHVLQAVTHDKVASAGDQGGYVKRGGHIYGDR